MTIEQRVAVLEEIFAKLRDYYILLYSGEEIDALLASAGVPIGITKEYDSVSAMNDDFSSTDVTRGQFVLILTTDTSSEDYGKVYLKGSANWVYVFTLTSLTAIKGPQGPAGKTGAKGADGADGKNFMVLGYYETLSALNAAVPSPGTGDTYGVGTEPPYAFYMYDPTISNWRYVGSLQGPAGPTGGEDNFVRYDAAQSLTNEQKAQARTNIGADTVQGTVRYDAAQTLADAQKAQARGNIEAAQSGYGLGGDAKPLTAADDVNTIGASGWYSWVSTSVPTNAIAVTSLTIMRVDAYNSGVKVQTLYGATDGVEFIMQPIVARRMIYGSKIGAWEYVNPPLALGVEYRTTERYLGKPVYVKVVNFGALPANNSKVVQHGISNYVQAIKYDLVGANDNACMTNFPGVSGIYSGAVDITIITTSDVSGKSVNVIIYYTTS